MKSRRFPRLIYTNKFDLLGVENYEMKNLRPLAEGKSSSSLTIAPISYEDGGVYECVADNSIQPAIKSNFTLTIRGRERNSHVL